MSAINQKNILGTRGTTMVYEDEWKEKPVAIKQVELCNTDQIDQIEVKALKKLKHPNIVKLLHDHSDENCRFKFTSCLEIIYKLITSIDNYKFLLLNVF